MDPTPNDHFYYDPVHPPTRLDKLLFGLWRFSDSWLLRIPSRILCVFGYHVWLVYDGRPLNCGRCGLKDHPLALREVNEQLKDLEVKNGDKPADQRIY